MLVQKTARIDLNRPKKTLVHVSQEDNTQQAKVMLYVDGRPYDVTADIDNNETVIFSVRYILPNQYGDEYTETALGESACFQDLTIKNLYTVNIDGACTDTPGFVELMVNFSTAEGRSLTSFPLTLNVHRTRGSDVDPDGGSPATSRYLRKDLQTPATEDMTQPVGVTPEGLLVTAPGGGGGGSVDQMKYFGYATSSDDANNNRTASLSGFALNKGGIVVIRFTTDVNKSSATLAVGSTAAKGIRYQNAALSGGEIRANDTVAFMYDGTYYRVMSIVRSLLEPLVGGSGSITPAQVMAAVTAGRPVTIIYIDQAGAYSFASWSIQPINGTATVVGSAITPNGSSVTLSGTSASSAWTFATHSGEGGSGTLQHSYGFMSQAAYEAFVEDYPDAIQPGDFIYITDRAQNNVSVKIYQRNDLGTLNQIITTIGDSYIVTLTESSGTWSASHDGNPVTFANIVNYGVNEGKRIVAYIPSLGLYIPADYIFATGSDQYIQFDAVTLGAAGRMGQSFLITSEGVRGDIKALGKIVVHATTQDNGQSYLVDYYASQIIAMRQYDANIVLVDGLTGDEYPLIGDNGSTAAYFGGFNKGMTKTVLFTVFNATNVPSKSEAAYPPPGSGDVPEIPTPTSSDNGKYLGVVNGAYALRSAPSGGGVTLYSVTAVYRSGYWYIQHDGVDIAAEDIFTALFGGALVQFVDDAGSEGDLMEVSYSAPGAGHLVYKTSNMDNNTPGWRLFAIQDEIVQSSPRAEVTMAQVDLLPPSDSRTASQVGSGFTVDGNTVYTVSGTISGFALATNTLPTMLPGQCVEIRLTVGSTAITTSTWPSWAKLMNGWDGNFSANTYYDLIIDDAGNVFAGTREVSA